MESYQGILTRMEEAYREETGREVTAVSDLGLRLRVLAGELFRLEGELEWLGRQAFPQTAWGEELDLHGAQRGLPRREAKQAAGVLTFSRYLPLDFDLVIPAGTVAASGGEEAVEYETTEEGTLTAGELTVDVPARAVAGGAQGNAASGYINTLVTPVSGIDYVVNEAAFTGGEDREPDDSYRERIRMAPLAFSTAGPSGAYEYFALSADPSVGDVYVVRMSPGVVGIYVVKTGGVIPEAGDPVLQAVLDACDDKTRRPLTDSVQVMPAVASNTTISAQYWISAADQARASSIQSAVAQAVDEYKAWQTEQIGRAINPDELRKRMLNAGASRITLTAPVYTELDANEVAQFTSTSVTYQGVG